MFQPLRRSRAPRHFQSKLSPRTIGNHLARVYTRLGVETRTAAARIALTAR
jgi:DNA-binding NarL/FixJ family response regulator